MWILLRLMIAAVVGLLRYRSRQRSVEQKRRTGDVDWVIRQRRKKGGILSTSFGVAFPHPVFFRLTPERGADRFFKTVGFSREPQSGDVSFDRRIYVACDHPLFDLVLKEDAEARAAILELFARDAKYIMGDGAHLWVHRSGDKVPDPATLALLMRVRAALQTVPAQQWPAFRDPFFLRAAALDAAAWGVASYGVIAGLEHAFRSLPLYPSWIPVLGWGALLAVVFYATLIGVVRIWLRGSSRAHRIFLEGVVVFALGVPLAAVEVVSDVNIALDGSANVILEPIVERKWTTHHRTKGGVRVDYHLALRSEPESPLALLQEIKVPLATFNTVETNGRLRVTVGKGALGVPWIVDVHSKPWRPR